MTKYFVDADGNYLGGFDGAEPPAGAIEVPHPPHDGRQKWQGGAWGAVPISVPASVTRRQAKQALLAAGLLNSVQPAINAIPDPTTRQMMQIEWDDSQEFERNRPTLIQLGHALGLTDAQLDALFIQAASL